MVQYNIVKYCRRCKVRFLVDKGQAKKNYCAECQRKFEEEQRAGEQEE